MGLTRLSPTVRTGLLAAVLVLAGAGLAAWPDTAALVPVRLGVSPAGLAVTVALLFTVAELHLVHTEFRRQAYSFTLAGTPLLMGLLLLPGRDVVAARAAGALLAFLVQRPSAIKAAYNTAAYVFEAALGLLLLHAVLGAHPGVVLATAATFAAVVAADDAVMGCLVLVVISFYQGPVRAADARAVLLPALVFSVACSALGLAAVLLLQHGILGVVLLLATGAAVTAGYRGYQVLYRRHEALTLVHQFVSEHDAGTDVDDLAARLLTRARTLMRAARAELVVTDGPVGLRLAVDEHDQVSVPTADGHDWLLSEVRHTGRPALLPRSTRNPRLRAWLRDRGVQDGLVVTLPRPGADAAPEAAGLLVVTDRLGETATFTTDDLRLLQTLAAHLAVALRNTELLARLQHDAHHDALTGLSNRTLFNARLEAALAAGDEAGVAVLLLDLDRFKDVNDTLGHHVGDELLVVLGRRLVERLPAGATVARLGGDEFAVLLTGLTDAPREGLAAADEVARALGQAVTLPEAALSCQVSVGVGLGEPGLAAADVLRHADTAMYAAKAGAGASVVYTCELDRGRAERIALLADLHLALERQELTVSYQPKVDLRTGRVTGAEALVRWQHPRLGPLSPDVFVPLAESTGLIEDLTRQVLGRALQQCRRWLEAGLDLTVAVNLSGRSIGDTSLPERIGAALAHAGLPADRLVLEVTESSALADASVTIPVLERLAAIGVTLSLDDFGTGYSSLAYLHRLPVREVKIDRSFVQGLADPARSASSEALIRSTISIAASLGLRTVAEGIEDEATLERLRAMGCDHAQGYLVGHPGSGDDLARSARRATIPTPRLQLLTS